MHASAPASASALYSAWHETTRSMRSIAVMALERAARRIATAHATLPVASLRNGHRPAQAMPRPYVTCHVMMCDASL